MKLPPPSKSNALTRHDNGRGRTPAVTVLDDRCFKLPPWLFDEGAGGVQIAGDPGSGKSNLMAWLMTLVARRGHGLLLLDPHGDLARLMRRLCLNMGESVRRRLYFVCPADTSIITPINPLGLDAPELDDLTYRARVTVKVAHMALILLHAWGERDFNSKPVMFKWTTRILRMLALIGLPLAEVRHFFDMGSPLFHAILRAVPDIIARMEFGELARMRPIEREELIASTKNRFLGFLDNPIVEAMFSKVDGISIRRLMAQNAIILVDLSPQGVLRDEDQEIIANTWVTELLHAVYNCPEHERVPFFAFLDELPVFASSGPQITAAMRQVRKMKLRIIAAHQGTQFFPEKQDDPLLHALISCAGTHFYFRHCDPIDAKFYGEIVAFPTLDPLKVKHELVQQQQYQDGFDAVVTEDFAESSNSTRTEGGGEGTATTQTDTWNQDHSSASGTSDGRTYDQFHRMQDMLSRARNEVTAQRAGRGGSTGTQQTSNTNWSNADTQGQTRTWKTTLVPRLKWRDVVTSVQFYTTEEEIAQVATKVASQTTGRAFMHMAGRGIAEVTLPLIRDPFRLTPQFLAKLEAQLREQLLRRPEYVLPSALAEERQLILAAFLGQLQQLPAQASQPAALATAGPATGQALLTNTTPAPLIGGKGRTKAPVHKERPPDDGSLLALG